MLKPSATRVVLALCCGFGMILVAAWFSGSTGEVCEIAQSGQKECASYNLAPFILIQIFKILHTMEGALLALATIAIAFFTWTLKRSTDRLWGVTNNTLKHAEITAERQLRAYVFIEHGQIELEGSHIRGEITFKNFGQTPAYDFEAWANVNIFEKGKPNFSFNKVDVKKLTKIPLGPGGTSVVSRLRRLRDGELQAIYNGDKRAYMWGKIVYVDAFKNTQEFEFRNEAAPGSRRDNKWNLAPCPDPEHKA